jgi:hypothetical protein
MGISFPGAFLSDNWNQWAHFNPPSVATSQSSARVQTDQNICADRGL